MWDKLRSKLSRSTHYPPPRAENADVGKALGGLLERFHGSDARRFVKLFLRSKPLACRPEEQEWFDEFERAGLVRAKVRGLYFPCACVFPFYGAMIATDLATHRAVDQVFALMFEQLYIVKRLGIRDGDRALELCVGSGVNSVFLSDTAASVTAVDISARALEFARFNIALNPGGVEVDLRHGSLFTPLEGCEPFDYILVNPPFEPVPPGTEHFLHSHGGEDGLDLVREMLTELPAQLKPGGRFEMYTWAPGNDETSVLVDLLRAAFPSGRIEVHRVHDRPLDERLEAFRAEKGYAAWRQRLIDAGYTSIWGVFTRVDSEGPAETVILDLPDEIEACLQMARDWD